PRRAAGAGPRVAVRGVAVELVERLPGSGPARHHAGEVCRLVPGPRRGAEGTRHADRPREPLVPRAGRPAAGGVADGGLRARPVDGRVAPARRRPVRRDRGRGPGAPGELGGVLWITGDGLRDPGGSWQGGGRLS